MGFVGFLVLLLLLSLLLLDCTTVVLALSSSIPTNHPATIDIEPVTTRRRLLDVHVLRNWSCSVSEYCQQQHSATSVTPQQALEHLTRNHWNNNNNNQLVQLVAILPYKKEDDDKETVANDWLERTNHVVGAVDLDLPSQQSLQQHENYYYLKNLRVHERVRNQGIGSALVQHVLDYAINHHHHHHQQQHSNNDQQQQTRVVLSTDDQHHLYARHGFVAQPDGITMIWEEP